jgi:site-specific recombinase XerC
MIWDLQLKDIVRDHLRVRSKNEKVRDVWLQAGVRKALSDYLEIRLPTDRNYVFTSRRGRMSYENIRQRMARVASMVGVRFHNHMARHAYAT